MSEYFETSNTIYINVSLHFCASGVTKVVDNICRLSPDLLAETVSMFYQKTLLQKRKTVFDLIFKRASESNIMLSLVRLPQTSFTAA